MKIIYFFKNLKITKAIKNFIGEKVDKLKKFLKKDFQNNSLVEIDIIKESKFKKGFYKAKIVLDLPKKSIIIAKGVGKNIMQAINDGFKKLFRQLRRKP